MFWCLVWQNSYVHSVFEQNVVIGGLGLSELIRRHVRTLICQVTLSGSWQVMIKFYLSALDHQTSPGKRHGRSIKSRPNDFSMRGFLYKKINKWKIHVHLPCVACNIVFVYPGHVTFHSRQGVLFDWSSQSRIFAGFNITVEFMR